LHIGALACVIARRSAPDPLVAMPPLPSPAISQPVWDGHALDLSAPAGTSLEVRIDQSRFTELVTDHMGHAHLELPFSPSGHARLSMQIASRLHPEEAAPVNFGIEIGKPGLQPSADEPPAVAALGQAEMLVPLDSRPMQREIAIVVPVYNAPDDVECCLNSVLAHSTGRSRLIVIDDASTDARIAPLLERYRRIDGVEILANTKNLGFTATVNRGIAHAEDCDVVLLNADAEVAAHWLTGLRHALHAAGDIATATAVSDNAGAFSVPEIEQENAFPDAWTFAQTALALRQSAGFAYPQLPTGNGFCMLIRREVIDAIGAFDVEAFPQGYGEENDFCQRACAAGYRHVITGNVLVRHSRSRSFGHERRESLGRAGMQVLRERWPRYEEDVGATLFSFARRVLDWRVRRIHADADRVLPRLRVLCFETDSETSPSSGYDMLMLNRQENRVALGRPDNAPLETADRLDAATLSQWLQRHAVDLIAAGVDADVSIVSLLTDQSERLGIPILRMTPGAASARRFDDQLASQKRFAGSPT
jgi:GT2 family glycosyltransferase